MGCSKCEFTGFAWGNIPCMCTLEDDKKNNINISEKVELDPWTIKLCYVFYENKQQWKEITQSSKRPTMISPWNGLSDYTESIIKSRNEKIIDKFNTTLYKFINPVSPDWNFDEVYFERDGDRVTVVNLTDKPILIFYYFRMN